MGYAANPAAQQLAHSCGVQTLMLLAHGSSIRLICPAFLLLAISASAQPTANPYHTIAERNVFRLHAPPPPQPVESPVPPRPVPNLILTGIADFSTVKWVFVTRTDPGQPPKNYTLTLGETEGGLQVMNVDANAATVTLRVDGTETVALQLGASDNKSAKPSALSGPHLPSVALHR